MAGIFKLGETAGVKVLGPVPQGLPALTIPWLQPGDLVPVLIGGIAVAIVAFADTSVLSRTYAARTNTRVDPNQEMVGLGAPISPPASSRASRSAAAPHGRRLRKRQARRRS
jgi:MFS superfamily sulfate permease-like transporter